MPQPRLSYLAPPDQVSDWRMVLLFDAATQAELLTALPGTPAQIAAARGLDDHAVRVVLDLLEQWAIVEHDGQGGYRLGRAAPDEALAAQFRHHARSIRMWSATIDERLRGVVPQRWHAPPQQELWYAALAAFARPVVPAVVDACRARFPDAKRLLDLGGGHGEYAKAFATLGLDVTLQDRPEAIELTRRSGIEDAGVDLFAGDFFTDLPDGPFDVVLCASVTDTYDREHNQRLYARLLEIVAPGGGIAFLAFVRDRNPGVPAFAVQMLTAATGGDTHSEDDYRRWLKEAGFGSVSVIDIGDRSQSLVLAER